MPSGDRIYKKALNEALKNEPDYELVTALLNKAFNLGSPEAAYALGTWYFHGHILKKNIKKGIQYWRIAAADNVPSALFDLGISFERGVGVKQSDKKAFEYYMRAALEGHKQAIYEVGRCYFYGIGIQKNRTLSFIWLDKARELGVEEDDEKEDL